MLKLLRDPVWQAIAAIVAIIAGVIAIFTTQLPSMWKVIGSILIIAPVIMGVTLLSPSIRQWVRGGIGIVQKGLRKALTLLREYWQAGAVVIVELVLLGLFEYWFATHRWVAIVAVVGNLLILLSALWLSRARDRFAKVIIVDPNGRYHEAKISPEADDEIILSGLVQRIGLPSKGKDGEPIKYRIDTSGTRKICSGGIIRIYKK